MCEGASITVKGILEEHPDFHGFYWNFHLYLDCNPEDDHLAETGHINFYVDLIMIHSKKAQTLG